MPVQPPEYLVFTHERERCGERRPAEHDAQQKQRAHDVVELCFGDIHDPLTESHPHSWERLCWVVGASHELDRHAQRMGVFGTGVVQVFRVRHE